ncbi:unnamed protein product, partial [marine sediment metagenome]
EVYKVLFDMLNADEEEDEVVAPEGEEAGEEMDYEDKDLAV